MHARHTLLWLVLTLALSAATVLPAAAVADTTFGGDPTLAANATTTDGGVQGVQPVPLGCAYGEPEPQLAPNPPFNSPPPNQTCTWWWQGTSGSDFVPFGNAGGSGTITSVTLPAMANPGPMQVVVFTGTTVLPQGAQPGQTDFACCRVKAISAPFTVPPNQVATVPLSLPVAEQPAPAQAGDTSNADILGISMLGPQGASMPLHFSGDTSDNDALYYPARSVTDANEEQPGTSSEYQVLARYTLSTGGGPAPAPTPTPGPAPAPAPGSPPAVAPTKGLTLTAKLLTLAAKGGALALGTAKNPPTASTTQTLIGALSSKKKAKRVVLGRGTTKVARGKHATLTVKLTKAARRVLAKHRTLTVTETVVAKGANGATATTTRTLKLRQAKPKPKRRK